MILFQNITATTVTSTTTQITIRTTTNTNTSGLFGNTAALVSGSGDSSSYYWLLWLILIPIGLILLILIALCCCRPVNRFFYKHFNCVCCHSMRPGEANQAKNIDATVVYSEYDEAWVNDTLLSTLKSFKKPYKIHLLTSYHKGFAKIDKEQFDKLNSSKRIILPFSKNFIKEEWKSDNFKNALINICANDPNCVIIAINTGDLSNEEMQEHLEKLREDYDEDENCFSCKQRFKNSMKLDDVEYLHVGDLKFNDKLEYLMPLMIKSQKRSKSKSKLQISDASHLKRHVSDSLSEVSIDMVNSDVTTRSSLAFNQADDLPIVSKKRNRNNRVAPVKRKTQTSNTLNEEDEMSEDDNAAPTNRSGAGTRRVKSEERKSPLATRSVPIDHNITVAIPAELVSTVRRSKDDSLSARQIKKKYRKSKTAELNTDEVQSRETFSTESFLIQNETLNALSRARKNPYIKDDAIISKKRSMRFTDDRIESVSQANMSLDSSFIKSNQFDALSAIKEKDESKIGNLSFRNNSSFNGSVLPRDKIFKSDKSNTRESMEQMRQIEQVDVLNTTLSKDNKTYYHYQQQPNNREKKQLFQFKPRLSINSNPREADILTRESYSNYIVDDEDEKKLKKKKKKDKLNKKKTLENDSELFENKVNVIEVTDKQAPIVSKVSKSTKSFMHSVQNDYMS